MTPAPFIYNATVLNVVDGDTIRVQVDRGFRDYSIWTVRILGINTYEVNHPGGYAARAHLREVLPIDAPVNLTTAKDDKFAPRKLATVTYAGGDLAEHLISEGWAVAWDGRGPAPYPVWPREGM